MFNGQSIRTHLFANIPPADEKITPGLIEDEIFLSGSNVGMHTY